MHIADHDFRQKTIFPGDTIRFDNLRRIDEHLCQSFYLSRPGAHPHMRRYDETEDCRIDRNRISTDCARIFQLVDTLGYAGAGQANLSCKIADRHATVLGQCGDYGSIGRIEQPGNVTASIHC